jgi:hypothetical protein
MVAAVAAVSFGATAQAAGRPSGSQVPRGATHIAKALRPPQLKRDTPQRSPRARAAAWASGFAFGKTSCPDVASSSATQNSAKITGPMILNGGADWYVYWNGAAWASSNWQVQSWDGPYWMYGNSSMVYDGRTKEWGYSNDYLVGSTWMTWPLRTAGLGKQYVQNWTTGEVRQGWTTAMNGTVFAAGGTCSNF